MPEDKTIFQNYMPGNVCFGCGTHNPDGLHIQSYWQDDIAVCQWQPQTQYQGWQNLTCGGVIATIVDCHCIATAMATAKRNEHKPLNSEPHYLFATGTMTIKYLLPTPINKNVEFKAWVTDIKNDKKYTLHCDVYAEQEKTVEAEVVALLVYRSDKPEQANKYFQV